MMQHAGILSFGPFRFGDDRTSAQVEEIIGGVPMVWAETAHFRIGSTLDSYDWPTDKEERKRLQGELVRLGEALPTLKGKRKLDELDPWLRLHLYALRVEDVYGRFLDVFDVDARAFPATPVTRGGVTRGPFLGLPEKFTLLLCDKQSEFGRYASTCLAWRSPTPYRYLFPKVGSMFFGTAEEFLQGEYANDLGLHCLVASAVVQNLLTFYGGTTYDLAPFFLTEGVGHWFTREIDERYPSFTGSADGVVAGRADTEWAPRVRARVVNGVFPTTAEMLAWNDPDEVEYAEHMILWSRIDHLARGTDGALGRLLRALRPANSRGIPGEAVERVRAAFEQAVGQPLADYDAAWARWVEDEYPR